MTRITAVSEPTLEMVAALASVERRLTTSADLADRLAADLADRLAAGLGRREADLAEIRGHAPKGVRTGEPCPCLPTAFELAALTRRGLQHSTDVGDELLVFLELTRRDLDRARETISESGALAAPAGVSSADLETLRHWVGHLDRIVQSATNGAERAITHLHRAEQAFAELAAKPGVALGERGQEARAVHAVVNDSESHITRAKLTLGLARAFLEDGKLAVRQGTEVARRLLAKEVLPVGMRQVRRHPVTVRGEAPAGAHGRSRLAPLT